MDLWTTLLDTGSVLIQARIVSNQQLCLRKLAVDQAGYFVVLDPATTARLREALVPPLGEGEVREWCDNHGYTLLATEHPTRVTGAPVPCAAALAGTVSAFDPGLYAFEAAAAGH